MIKGLFETHIRVADFDRSRRFYERQLGLEVGWIDESQRRLLYWVGGPGKAMLGVWEAPPEQVSWAHFAFEVTLDDMRNAAAFLRERGIKPFNKIDGGENPQVFGWMPAVALYFKDPDGHLLEFIAMLPGKPRPDAGLVTWEQWERTSQGATGPGV